MLSHPTNLDSASLLNGSMLSNGTNNSTLGNSETPKLELTRNNEAIVGASWNNSGKIQIPCCAEIQTHFLAFIELIIGAFSPWLLFAFSI